MLATRRHRLRGSRLNDELLYGLAKRLAEPGTTFAWVDAEDRDLESKLKRFADMPGPRRVIAYRARTLEEGSNLNKRVCAAAETSRVDATEFIPIDARFATSEEWLAYVRALPTKRPADLHVDFMLTETHIRLSEGEYEFRQPWHCYVHKIWRSGMPGGSSHLAVAREHLRLTVEDVREPTRRIAALSIRDHQLKWQLLNRSKNKRRVAETCFENSGFILRSIAWRRALSVKRNGTSETRYLVDCCVAGLISCAGGSFPLWPAYSLLLGPSNACGRSRSYKNMHFCASGLDSLRRGWLT